MYFVEIFPDHYKNFNTNEYDQNSIHEFQYAFQEINSLLPPKIVNSFKIF